MLPFLILQRPEVSSLIIRLCFVFRHELEMIGNAEVPRRSSVHHYLSYLMHFNGS